MTMAVMTRPPKNATGIVTNDLERHRAGPDKPGQIAYRFDDDFAEVRHRVLGMSTLVALGSTAVTLTVTDAAGLSSSCTATVTVRDVTPPVVLDGSTIAWNRLLDRLEGMAYAADNDFLHQPGIMLGTLELKLAFTPAQEIAR